VCHLMVTPMADVEPRWLDAEAAARYLSMRVDVFLRAVSKLKVPPPSRCLGPRTPRWDRDALDAMMEDDAAAESTEGIFNAVAEKIEAKGRKGGAARHT
jgi:hypothetical protein